MLPVKVRPLPSRLPMMAQSRHVKIPPTFSLWAGLPAPSGPAYPTSQRIRCNGRLKRTYFSAEEANVIPTTVGPGIRSARAYSLTHLVAAAWR
jgi:hypothetical protein